jgi:hypothetical protein
LHTKMIGQQGPTPSSPGEEGTLESVDEETVTIQWPGSERKSVGLPEHWWSIDEVSPRTDKSLALGRISSKGQFQDMPIMAFLDRYQRRHSDFRSVPLIWHVPLTHPEN